ncbi:MAG TPA: Gfo/Idh/MocA family oxidoreductase [Verrucomicrobiae bacterium]|jgi:predicted dehydrogenase|nr:Gfo/Idh/MocA family oxidoreductase [Verrucomicrobiae bacterium]
MKKKSVDRREFIKTSGNAAAGMMVTAGLSANAARGLRATSSQSTADSRVKRSLKFSVIGINHDHIYAQVEATRRGGGELVSLYAKEPELAAAFSKRYPDVKLAGSEKEILDDPSIKLILSASIPADRAPLGLEVMRHGKDFMVDKPGMTSLEQLAEVRSTQKATGRIYSIMYSERFENRATVRAGELMRAGAIGRVLQTIGTGPHRMNPAQRPPWFFEREQYGGILCDIGSHQFDQFLYFTNSTKAEIVASQIGNLNHPQYPGLEDFGDVMLRGDHGTGYIRVDWFTPDGLATWGDGRLFVLGTDGYFEIRKNVDIAGRNLGSFLFQIDQKGTRYIDCQDVALPYGEQLINDVLDRTDTAMNQEHCFYAMELALKAEKQAQRIDRPR